jgi:hypothetical protein
MELLGAMGHAEVELGTVTYDAAGSACMKAREWRQATGLLVAVRRAKREPDTITCNATSGASGSGQHDRLQPLHQRVQERPRACDRRVARCFSLVLLRRTKA